MSDQFPSASAMLKDGDPQEASPIDEEGFEVERILGTRYVTRCRGRDYFVKFRGYDEPEWIAAKNLGKCDWSVKQFLAAMGWTACPKDDGREHLLQPSSQASSAPGTIENGNMDSGEPEAGPSTSTRSKGTRRRLVDRSQDVDSATGRKKAKPSEPVANEAPEGPDDASLASTESSPSPAESVIVCEAEECDEDKPRCRVTCGAIPAGRFDISGYADAVRKGFVPSLRRNIHVSLEDVFVGCRKTMTVACDNWAENFDVQVRPGTLAGQQWVYPLPDGNTVTFVLRDVPHEPYHREGYDLHYVHRMPLRDALLGSPVSLQIFTGEVINFEFDKVVFHGFIHRVEGYGFPLPDQPWQRGYLVVTFDVVFPEITLDSCVKEKLRQHLPGF